MTVTDSNFNANNADKGGAIYGSSMTVHDSTFINNTADNGGAIYSSSSSVIVYGSTFTHNTANSGGAIYAYNVAVTDSTFTHNTANHQGGAIYAGTNVAVTGSTFINNTADYGGAILSNGNNAAVTNSTFIHNKATTSGGAIYAEKGILNVIDSIFTNNSANDGGAIYTYTTRVSVIDSTFEGNNATNDGGAIRGGNFTIIRDSVFINNSASHYGGVVYGATNVTGSFFQNNKDTNGYSIYMNYTNNASMNYNVILDNYIVYQRGQGTVNLNNNWWETNNYTIIENKFNTTNFDLNNYYFMNITSNDLIDKLVGDNFTFIYGLYLNGTTNNTNVSNLPKFNVNLTNNGINIDLIDARFNTTLNTTLTDLINNISAFSHNPIITLTVTAGPGSTEIIIDSPINATFGDTFEIVIKLVNQNNNSLSGENINITIGGINYSNITDANGTIIINYTANKVGLIIIEADFNGTNRYNESNNTINFNVFKAIPLLNIDVDDIVFGENATININVTGVNGEKLIGNVTIRINNKEYNVTLINGIGQKTITGLPAGNYTIYAIFEGNENYTKISNNTVSFNVNKATPLINVTVDDITIGENATLNITLTPSVIGNVTISIDGTDYDTFNLTNGILIQNISGLTAGTHNITVTFNGNTNYTVVSKTVTVNVKENITINIPPVINNTVDNTITVDVPVNATGNMTLTIGNTTITSTIVNGTVSFDLGKLPAGNHTGTITYDGDSNFNGFNKTFNITVNKGNVILNANNITMYFRNGTQYVVTLTDSIGNPIAGVNLTITINGINYTRTTNINGTAIMNLNLNPGDYVIKTTFNGNTDFNPSLVTSFLTIKTILFGQDLVKHYKNATQYTIQVLDGQGNELKNTTVQFNINGIFYNRTTDSNGVATLNINLFPGEYIITSTYNGLSKSNTIKVLPTLIGFDLTKTFGTPDQFNVKVLNEIGEGLASQIVKINIHGMLYDVTSGIDGIAKLNINLNPGSYIATSTWNDYSTSNVINVNP